ncbi:DUF3422 domain containing protein [Sulfitobacter noctilucicola]|uniref:Putative membrane-anchored protein n=1 Tax=Sulfitobacter noctilucicola TaxID=1342301 RepID=A0A7W6M855_9RHOB|nr:DUF3422 domain-containing protein [Sulfitobacter noctilucicola]KIN64636.1 DUF3422 domain containing protein [Sulfitobacter noctilucicola]MBB4174214.1 putative membrane-anchored protein [Sulfitobacter noctilucicola]
MAPIKDYPQRYALTGELHARPFPSLKAPSTAVFLAIKQPDDAANRDKSKDLAHLIALLDHYGAPRPDADATHYYGEMGRYWLKWEQHTELVTYTVFRNDMGDRAFDPSEFDVFPEYWLMDAPGGRITSALLRIMPRPPTDDAIQTKLSEWFVPESLAVASVLDDAAVIASDFRIDSAGHLRIAIFKNAETGDRRTGRIVQRLCEIETYKSASMLGFSMVRWMAPQLNDLDAKLEQLMAQMRGPAAKAEDTLHALLDISVELETLSVKTAFRFGATGAYRAIVGQRIEALREERFMSRQGFAEFMMRRYEPAMRTVESSGNRLQTLSARAIRASELLRTRVDVERSAQNQEILASMDKRADLQLRLQKTVEGLSVVAISYYAVSLAGYLLYPVADAFGVNKGTLLALVTLPVVGAVWAMVRRLRKHLD